MTGQNKLSVADSNIYLRLLIGDVPAQSEQALTWLEKQPQSSVIVSDAVLVEVLFLLESQCAYGLKRADFLPRLLRLLRSIAWNVPSSTQDALTLFGNSKLDYVDCLLWAMQTNAMVSQTATFNKDLQKMLDHEANQDLWY